MTSAAPWWKDDRLIGGLWEEFSGGKCYFGSVTDKECVPIAEKLGA